MTFEPIDIPGLDDEPDPPRAAPSRAWNVARTWWALTKLILAGRGGYDLCLRVEDLPDEAQRAFDRENWSPTDIDWVGGEDRLVFLIGEPTE